MDYGIKGRRAIVCASSKGLGRGCATALAEAGCDVVVNGRDPGAVKSTARDIRAQFPVEVLEVVADVSTREGQKALLEACPSPDILVNNNGGPPFGDFRKLSRDDILKGVVQNMVTPIELIQAVIDGMSERGFGRIVNITSLSVYRPLAGLDLSSGARAGLTAFVSGIARSVAAHNVTINNILPGKFDTARIRETVPAASRHLPDTEQIEYLVRDIPARRLGTAEEFGRACAFLCSAPAGYITGQNLRIDGGLFDASF